MGGKLTAGVDVAAEIRYWSPDPVLGDGTVVDLLGKLYAPPNATAWIDVIQLVAFPGDPADAKYEDGVPERPFPTMFVLGHSVGQAETMDDNISIGYAVKASEYVRDQSRSSQVYCRFDGMKARWKKTPRPQAGSAVYVVGIAYGVHLGSGHLLVDVDQLQLGIGSSSASVSAPRSEQGGPAQKRRRFQTAVKAAPGSADSGTKAPAESGPVAGPSKPRSSARSAGSDPAEPAREPSPSASSLVDLEAVEAPARGKKASNSTKRKAPARRDEQDEE
ncbi:hypothetical protein AURDEDRAFT_160246 [Auricularia subglabra TFB-10046 SS5]|nr:hypothetical protein AURDEDRAFT_160246 [Auricularia subglabra TFB-10046 SS5]